MDNLISFDYFEGSHMREMTNDFERDQVGNESYFKYIETRIYDTLRT